MVAAEALGRMIKAASTEVAIDFVSRRWSC